MMYHDSFIEPLGGCWGTATSVAAAARAAAEQTWSGEERPKEAGAKMRLIEVISITLLKFNIAPEK